MGSVSRKMTVRIISGLTELCVYGMDLAEEFGLIIHAKNRKIWMTEEPLIKFSFEVVEEGQPDRCKGNATLSKEEREELNVFLKQILTSPPNKLPVAKFVEHIIHSQEVIRFDKGFIA